MKRKTAIRSFLVLLLVAGCPALALAAGAENDWRPTYDLIMRWVNFLILVFLIVKFGRRPLAAFVRGRQEDIATAIGDLEERKSALLKDCEAADQQLKDSQERLVMVRERIQAQGEKRKSELIEAANEESRILIENTKRKIEGQVLHARKALHEEVVDSAITIALERLPSLIEPEDQRRQEERFIEAIGYLERSGS